VSLGLVVCLAVGGALVRPAAAQDLQAVGVLRSSGPATSPESAKIVSRLRALIGDFRSLGITARNATALGAAQRFSSEALRLDHAGRVQVNVTVADTSDATLARLRQHGLDVEIVNADFGVIEGWISVENLEPLAGEAAVQKIRPPSYATPRTGAANSQGDAAHRCDQARALGYTGSGAPVGVISNGVDGLAASQATGDLPAVTVLANFPGDEGTAMLEIVHDCAPGAPLLFATGFPSALAFVSAVNALQTAGARIIVDDLAFYAEPYFEDGVIALNDRTAGTSVLRVSAAGNDRTRHYAAAAFSPGVFDPEIPGTRHNFGGGDTLMRFSAGGGSSPVVVLQWANPFGTAADDYDLCVRLTSGGLLGCSAVVQDGNDDPLEIISLTCPPGPGCTGDIQITRFSGAARPLKLYCLSCTLQQFAVPAGSIFGHQGVPEVLAVVAAFVGTPTVVEGFSSLGPSTILFPAVATRPKPDLTGVDGVTTTRPGFNPFFGTSAAAPHVAAIAALVLSKNPSLGPVQLRNALTGAAIDIGSPGFDSQAGFGLADAFNALLFTGGAFVAAARVDAPGAPAEIITGPGPGGSAGGPHVKVFRPNGTPLGPGFLAYDPGFTGGVHVAACDFDGDGRDEVVVTGPGAGGGPHVRALQLDASGNVVAELASFFAYDPAFTGGVFVACGPVEGPGARNIVTGPGPGGGPHLRILRYQPGAPGGVVPVFDFLPYHPAFTGGVHVAVGDANGPDGRAEVVTAPGAGGGPHVRVLTFDSGALTPIGEFFAYDPAFTGGVFVATGDVTSDGVVEVITGPGSGGGPHVRAFSGAGVPLGGGFFAYSPQFTAGVRVAAGDFAGNGAAEIVTAPGAGGGPHVIPFALAGTPVTPGFFAY
jgi:subtilisin family serine protease